jgi:hypothetical protein
MSELDLVEVIWVYDEELDEWVLIAWEVPPRGEGNDLISHWMRGDD